MPPRLHINGPLTWSLVFVGAVVIAMVLMAPPVVRAALSGGSGETEASETIARLMSEHDRWQETYEKRFEGRSVFFKPPQPPPPRPERVARTRDPEPTPPSEPVDTGPPPAPRNYTGPEVYAVIGDQVMFAGALRIRVGEEANGVKVLSVKDSPRSVRLAHARGEYDVPLFPSFEFPEAEPKTGVSRMLSGSEAKEVVVETPSPAEGVATLTGDETSEEQVEAGVEPVDPGEELAAGDKPEDPAADDPEAPEDEPEAVAGGEDPEEDPATDPEEDPEELAGANDPTPPNDQATPEGPASSPPEPAGPPPSDPDTLAGATAPDGGGGVDAGGARAPRTPPTDDGEDDAGVEPSGVPDDQDEPSPTPTSPDDPNS